MTAMTGMPGDTALDILVAAAGAFLVLYWLWMLLSSNWLCDWLLGIPDPPRPLKFTVLPEDVLPERTVPPAPHRPIIRRSFGPHRNPISLKSEECLSDFEQMDERCWQCLQCGLVHFEKPAVVTEATSDGSANG